MRIAAFLLVAALAGCAAPAPAPTGPAEEPPTARVPPPREILNASFLFGSEPLENDAATFDVSPNATQLLVEFLMHEAALGASFLRSEPGREPQRFEAAAPDGDPWVFPLVGVIDLNPGPTPPWYAGHEDRTQPAAGTWAVTLIGWGHNVQLDLVVVERSD